MKGLLYLSWRHLAHNPRAALLSTLCLATTAFLPLATRMVTHDFERDLVARAAATPLVAGAKGSRFDLVFAALWFRPGEVDLLRVDDLATLRESPLDVVVPLNLRHTARGLPVVATSPEYFECRGLRAATGGLPLWIGECALGSEAFVGEVDVGDTLFTDALGGYDLAGAAPLELAVTGRLARTNGPDDRAVFVSTETGWMLEGALHGHGAPAELDASQLLGAGTDHVLVGPALVEHRRAEAETRADFHLHAERASLPVSAALVFPASKKSRTMLKARVGAQGDLDVVEPRLVVEELLSFVFRIRALLDLFAAVLGGATVLMGALVILLSLRLRAGELATLERLGASRGVAARLVATETVVVLAAALALAGFGLLVVRAAFPDLMDLIR